MTMHSPFRHTAAAVAMVVLAAACGDPSSPGTVQAALTIVHATSTLDPIDVMVGDEPVVSGLAYGEASAPITVPSGIQRIIVHSGNDTIADFQTTLTTEHVNALVVANGSAQVAGTVIPDTGAVAVARAN